MITNVLPNPPANKVPTAQRVVLHHISWETYLQILTELGDRRTARLAYDQGTLEIRMPLEQHDNAGELIGLFVRVLVEVMGYEIKSMGSTTLNREDLQKGAEPDRSFYIQNQPLVAGKIVDLNQDPPPDIVVEVDITHMDINKPALYASMGVPEFWRYNGQVLEIYVLQGQTYQTVETSPTFPIVTKTDLYEFLQACQTGEIAATRSLRVTIQKRLQDLQ
ncbi:Putative restriction endonuclease domain-containing protein [Tumidithrix helvetica PCC 7403]|uniref:Uma2 family endonuclease n=1 Tax=Tumidithrix helvetica TaxID=3457545 RepID=UPI003C966172